MRSVTDLFFRYYAPLGTRVEQAAEFGITAATTDDELAEIICRERRETEEDHIIVEGLSEILCNMRRACRKAASMAREGGEHVDL